MTVKWIKFKTNSISATRRDLEVFTLKELRAYAVSIDVVPGKNKKKTILNLMMSRRAKLCMFLGDDVNLR